MLIKFDEWKNRICDWAKNNKGSYRIIKHVPLGSVGDSFTIEVNIKRNDFNSIIVSQSGGGTNLEVGLSHLMFENHIAEIYNLDLSLYRRDFLDRLFGSGKVNIRNKTFNKTFGISTSYKPIAEWLFNDGKIQALFINNKFLVFNISRKEHKITLKSMKTKFYEEEELQFLLDNFKYIINKLNEYYINKKNGNIFK